MDDDAASTSASASASVSAASLSAHCHAVQSWFASNLRELRSMDADYAALFDAYRAELRHKLARAAPQLLPQLDHSMQWKTVMDAVAAAAAAAAAGAPGANKGGAHSHAAGYNAASSMQQQQQQSQRAVRA